MNSIACSSVMRTGFVRMMFSSRPAARMFVSFLALSGLTTRSLSRLWMPTTWPSYTSSPCAHHQAAAFLQVEERIGEHGALPVRDHHAVPALGDLPVEHRRVTIEHVEHEPETRRQRAELGLEADQAARGNHVVEPHATLAVGVHRLQLPAAAAERRHDGALVRVLDVDRENLERLVRDTVDLACVTTRGRETAIS